ncbi:MAG TPA: ORF6N domain-containing protein [bacterium]|nr:ORF6N domain-containing protein [bacterium]
MSKAVAVRVGTIQQRVLLVRSEKVIIDADSAEFYGVSTKALNQAVRRNRGRFPVDFMFYLTESEKSEVGTVCDHLSRLRYSRTPPSVTPPARRGAQATLHLAPPLGHTVRQPGLVML